MPQTLSIIVPTYNEGANLTAILKRLKEIVLPCEMEKEIIVVDDGSTDSTPLCAQTYVEQNPTQNIRILRHTSNQGKGMAIRTALKAVTGDFVVIQDSDIELNPSDLVPMLKTMLAKDLEVVYGSRFLNGNNPISNLSFYYGTRLLSWVTNILYRQHITDEATCYKMFRTKLLRSIPLKCRGFEFCPEVTAKVARRGIKIAEVPIGYNPRSRAEGKKIRAIDGLKALYYLIKYRVAD